MSFTFGGGSSDAVSVTLVNTVCADNSCSLFAGWWYPTTLTGGRKYFGVGNTIGAEVDSTNTDEIRFRTDNTTDGQWLTTDANISVNNWWFIAIAACTENTTVAGAVKIWIGTPENGPVAATVTNPVTRSGNYTGNSGLSIGSTGIASAFQGDIGWMSILNINVVGINGMFTIGTSGVISGDEELNIYHRWVRPLWEGNPHLMYGTAPTMATNFTVMHCDLNTPIPLAYNWSQSTSPNSLLSATVSGAVYSESRPPKCPPANWPHLMPFVPSRR